MTINLSALNPLYHDKFAKDAYAVFIPALIPSFVQTASGRALPHRQDGSTAFLDNLPNSLNFLSHGGIFYYKWALYSAGLAELDIAKAKQHEAMIMDARANGAFLFADSGGYQIASNTLKKISQSDNAIDEFRQKSLAWMEACSSVLMPLDFPISPRRLPGEQLSCEEALSKTIDSLNFIKKHWKPSSDLVFVNVVQGLYPENRVDWIQKVKGYPSNAWAVPWRLHETVHGLLQTLVIMDEQGLFKNCKWLHLFGLSRLHFAGALTLLMRAMRQKYPELVISYDSAVPMTLAAKNGHAYIGWQVQHPYEHKSRNRQEADIPDFSKFTFTHIPVGKEFVQSTSNAPFPAIISPIGLNSKLKDFCVRSQPTAGGSCWDELSTALLCAHNVYAHILTITQLNRLMDEEIARGPSRPLTHAFSDFKAVVNEIFHPNTSNTRASNLVLSNKDVLQFFDRKNEVTLVELRNGKLPDWSSTDFKEFPEDQEIPLAHD